MNWEPFAKAFDAPKDSPEHRDLADHGWLVGREVTTRYSLSCILRKNLFRESEDSAIAALKTYLTEHGMERGASLVSDYQALSAVDVILKHHRQIVDHEPTTQNSRLVAALEAIMIDPELSNREVSDRASTTEKQVARMSDVAVIRKLWKHRVQSA